VIDPQAESLLTIKSAARLYPGRTGKGYATTTIWRWIKPGVAGVRLEKVHIGGQTYTSREALQRFHRNVAAAKNPLLHHKPTNVPSASERQARADKSAEAMGF
jgi:hypothetical protein